PPTEIRRTPRRRKPPPPPPSAHAPGTQAAVSPGTAARCVRPSLLLPPSIPVRATWRLFSDRPVGCHAAEAPAGAARQGVAAPRRTRTARGSPPGDDRARPVRRDGL